MEKSNKNKKSNICQCIKLIMFCLLMINCGEAYSSETLPKEIENYISSQILDFEMSGMPNIFIDCYKENIRKDFQEALKTKTFTPYENRYGSDAFLRQMERVNFILEITNQTVKNCTDKTNKLQPHEIKTTF